MNTCDILHVIAYEIKQQSRQWIFRLFILLSLVGVTLYQVFLQGQGHCQNWEMVALSCSVPLVNAYLFCVIQSLFVIIMMLDIPRREQRLGALESIYARSWGNGDYTWGRLIGYMLLFIFVNLLVILSCILFVNLRSIAPWGIEYYLFYFFTLNLPALIFMMGLSLWLVRIVRLPYVALLLMLIWLIISITWLPYHFHGTFDFLGSGLPNLFSEEIGHIGLGSYILQRTAFLLLGLGLMACSVKKMNRIPNDKKQIRQISRFGQACVLAGIICWVIIETVHLTDKSTRETFRDNFRRHWSETACRISKHDIVVKQEGSILDMTSHLTLYNPNTKNIQQPLLILNPGLKLISVKSGDQKIDYHREGQIILLDRHMNSGDSLDLHLTYRGSIDERFTDLQLPNDIQEGDLSNRDDFFQTGKRGAFVGDRFLLLTPACAWYPVAIAPVNPLAPLYSNKDMTRFRLTILHPRQEILLSQGRASHQTDSVLFAPSRPLSGISLCGGNYELRELSTDSLRLQLYTFANRAALFKPFEEVSEQTMDEVLINKIFSYPKLNLSQLNWYEPETKKLFFIETPLAFRVESIPGKSLSGLVEPGMVFLPEKGFGMNLVALYDTPVTAEVESKEIRDGQYVLGFGEDDEDQGKGLCMTFINDLLQPFIVTNNSHPLLGFFDKISSRYNPRYAIPLLQEPAAWIYSDKYPFIGNLFEKINLVNKEGFLHYGLGNARIQAVQDYIPGRSLEDIFKEPEIDRLLLEDIVNWKEKDLINRLTLNMSEDSLLKIIDNIYHSHSGVLGLDEFIRYTKIDHFEQILSDWFHARHQSAFKVRDWTICEYPRKDESGLSWFEIKGNIMNCGKEGNIVSVILNMDGTEQRYNCFIGPKEAKAFRMVCKNERLYGNLQMELSLNRPTFLNFIDQTKEQPDNIRAIPGTWTDIDSSVFRPEPNTIIVDDADPGFTCKDKELTMYEKKFGRKYKVVNFISPFKAGRVEEPYWVNFIGNAYGDITRGCHFKTFGKGNCTATWTTVLPEKGKYKVMAYVTQFIYGRDGCSANVMYHYTVKSANGEEAVEISLREAYEKSCDENWITLGEYDFPAGEVHVTLSDKGDKEELIIADAVKWVKMNP